VVPPPGLPASTIVLGGILTPTANPYFTNLWAPPTGMTVVNAKADPAAQKAAWDFLAWLNGPTSGPHGASAMGDILMSMGILPSRNSDVAAFKDQLNSPFLSAYVAGLPEARPYPVVLGGQEFTEALQQHVEAIEFGKESAAEAQKAAQADAVSILTRAAK